MKLTGLKPERVYYYFEKICSIPHGSYNTKAISDYCKEVAGTLGLACRQDDFYNLVIVKEAYPGYEEAGTVMLQGHLDMVCEKTADSEHDFMKDGLDLYIEDEFVRARNTTLGGDDGIAVAYALAIMEDPSIHHPRLEIVLTTEEEVGMDGANGLDCSDLKAEMLINLDSEEEGILLAGCAGGFDGTCRLPVVRQLQEGIKYTIEISGLESGHSGIEIHKGRANANKLMGRFLLAASDQVSFSLNSVCGGQKGNVITKEAKAELIVNEANSTELETFTALFEKEIRQEYQTADPDIRISAVSAGRGQAEVMDSASQERVIFFLAHVPNGIISMSADMAGLVQTSLNFGILNTEEDHVRGGFLVRSSVSSEKEEMKRRLKHFTEYIGGSFEAGGDCPAWKYRKDSPLRDHMVRVYEQQYGQQPKVEAIHAGLECGILIGKMPGLDCVSIGPDILDIHTVEEKMDISSVARVWDYLLAVLKEIH